MTPEEIKELPDGELQSLRTAITAELDRRESLKRVPEQIDALASSFLTAGGVHQGALWSAPTGSHDAYPLDWEVTHKGKLWRSTVRSNVWEPGTSGWRELALPGADPVDWVQPTGAHDAYEAGERVSYNGKVWVSVIEANVWAPGVYGWVEANQIDAPPTPEPEVIVPDEPEVDEPEVEEPEPEVEEPEVEPEVEGPADWVQPTGGHDAYKSGDLVTYNGAVYRSTSDGNVWAPGVYGWSLVQ